MRAAMALIAAAGVSGCLDIASTAEEPSSGGGAGGVGATSGTGGTPGDAGGGGGEAGSGFCANHLGAELCKDFDDGNPLGFGFNAVEMQPPCALALDSSSFASGPSSLLATVPAGAAADDCWAYVDRTLPSAAPTVLLSFDMQVNVEQIAESADVAQIVVDPEGAWHAFTFELHPNGARIEIAYPGDGSVTYEQTGLPAFPLPGKWSHVKMLLQHKVPPAGSIEVDGVRTEIQLPAGFAKDGLHAHVGIDYAPNQTKDLAVRYDNVLVELEP